MALNPKYVLAPSLQMYFVDKDTGLPLTNGKVFFYIDNTNIPKPVYELSGNPPDYTYTVLTNPVILSSVGTFQDDSGEDIIPYYYPFDDSGNVELYYIEVYDENGVLQFTRSGWPNTSISEVQADQDITNFVANGQFLIHNDIPASTANGFIVGKITQAVTDIAPGWTFERDVGSTATDIVTFVAVSPTTNPTGDPQFLVDINTTVSSSDTRKDLCMNLPGVNTFASNNQEFNLYFEAQAVTGSFNVEIIILKNYGTGGSATEEIAVSTVTLSSVSGFNQYNTTLFFDTNIGKTIGSLGDDYVQVIMRLPPTGVQHAQFTNFAITLNSTVLASYPFQTSYEQTAQSTAGALPRPAADGSSLYLPIVMTPSGFNYDSTAVGKIYATMSATPEIGELNCDGSAYRVDDYSSDGIPYSRLFNKLFNNTTNISLFGNGNNFVNTYASTGLTSMLMLCTNKPGAVTSPADGSTSTGFTFNTITNTGGLTLGFTGYANVFGLVFFVSDFINGPNAGSSAGTSTLNVIDYINPAVTGCYYAFYLGAKAASALAAGSGNPGLYFQFSSNGVNYYAWFFINGETDPAPGGTGIRINLNANWTVTDVAVAIQNAISRNQLNSITTISSPPAGSFFTFVANGVTYTPWYKVNNVGTAPTATFPIQIDLTGAETAAQVATKTQIALNSVYYSVPDLRGVFLRGLDTANIWDLDTTVRFGLNDKQSSIAPGSYQLSQVIQHTHTVSTFNSGNTTTTVGQGNGANAGSRVTSTVIDGGSENRPYNVYVNYVIKY